MPLCDSEKDADLRGASVAVSGNHLLPAGAVEHHDGFSLMLAE